MHPTNQTVYFSAFRGENDMDSFRCAAAYLREHPGTHLVIEPGDYLLTDERARTAQANVMAGRYGSNPQKVMFHPAYEYSIGVPLCGLTDCTVTAEGVNLLVDGFMEPVSLRDCTDVTVSGFCIRHRRRPYSRGRVTAVFAKRCLIEWDADCPVCEQTPLLLRHFFIAADSDKRICREISSIRFLDSHHIELQGKSFEGVTAGMLFYTVHTYHSRPTVLIENCRNITLKGTVIHNQPGMGIVGNRCENVTLHNVKVIPEAGHHLSTNTDATHFTAIKGTLHLSDCIADGQGDDFTNIHAYYQIVEERLGECTYRIRENTPDGTHAQSVDYPDVGDILELSVHKSLQAVGTYRVEAVEVLTKGNCCIVTLNKPLPADTEGYVLADITRLPKAEITGCVCRNHYARGILIKCRDAVIENNAFYNIMGPAVEIAAEAWWYEGVTPAHVRVANNRIRACAAYWGDAAGVVVKADCEEPQGQTITDIAIEHNVIDSPNAAHGIYCRNTAGLIIADNTVTAAAEPIAVEHCTQVTIQE